MAERDILKTTQNGKTYFPTKRTLSLLPYYWSFRGRSKLCLQGFAYFLMQVQFEYLYTI